MNPTQYRTLVYIIHDCYSDPITYNQLSNRSRSYGKTIERLHRKLIVSRDTCVHTSSKYNVHVDGAAVARPARAKGIVIPVPDCVLGLSGQIDTISSDLDIAIV